jgi:hypothetical protein
VNACKSGASSFSEVKQSKFCESKLLFSLFYWRIQSYYFDFQKTAFSRSSNLLFHPFQTLSSFAPPLSGLPGKREQVIPVVPLENYILASNQGVAQTKTNYVRT